MEDLNALKRLDVDGATYKGYIVGIIGIIFGVFSLIIGIYPLFNKDENYRYLVLSGWGAAIIISAVLFFIICKLVNVINEQFLQLQKIAEEREQIKAANQRLIEIDAYVIGNATRRTAERRRKSNEVPGVENSVDEGKEK
ncbi:hypothetical protein HNQ50_001917 [Silvimonas terrae]|uniref:Uncharacterized protein n=1 Tax=Silvimonas terrae TaxID=300266 RepID=A0A840RF48_9NEIS|nr:hypothetical protein [Silvimonas terrae]MBB5191194.1 hypothetical protein [Silvimonas terrae]